MRRALLGLALLLGVLASPAGAQPAPPEPLRLILDWFVNPDHAPIVVAQEKGFFRERGLEVEVIAPADPNDPPKLVAAGQADVAVSYQPQLHVLVDQGLPLVRVGTLVATPLNTLIVLEDSGITSLGDLKGKTIGFSAAGFEDALLGTLLKPYGLSAEDVTLVNVNFALTQALLSGQADAVIGGYRNFELNQLRIDGRPGRAFFVEEHGVPLYDELVFVAGRDRVADPKLARFMAAVEAGATYLLNHPRESLDLFLKAHPDLDDELNRRAFWDTLPRFAQSPFALDHGRYRRFAAFLRERGLIRAEPELSSYAVELPR